MGNFVLDPTNGSFSNQLPLKSVEKLAYLFSIEECYRYRTPEALGTYYPIRVAPSMSIDLDAEWPIIMPAGTIVSVRNIELAEQYNSAADTESGIGLSGLINVSVSEVDSSILTQSVDSVYDKEIAGLITICNGGTETSDSYSDNDGTYGIIDASGIVASATSAAYTRTANAPVGVVNSRIPADLRLRYLNYDALNETTMGNHIQLGGVLTLPYVVIYSTTEDDRNTVLTAIRGAVNSLHSFVWTSVNTAAVATAKASVASLSMLKSDEYGKFTSYVAASHDANQYFAKILESRNRQPYNLDPVIDSFPGSGMKGTDTGGLSARLFHFVKNIIIASGIKAGATTGSITNVRDALSDGYTTATGSVCLLFGQVDVAFGTLK